MALVTREPLQLHLFYTGRGLCQPCWVAYCMSHNMMETGNPYFASFPGLSILVESKVTSRMGGVRREACGPAAPSKPAPQFDHAEPSTDQIPCADLVPKGRPASKSRCPTREQSLLFTWNVSLVL